MGKDQPPAHLLLDACVLIDYYEVAPITLRLVAVEVAPIVVSRAALRAVGNLDEVGASKLGIRVFDIDPLLFVSAKIRHGAVSMEDAFCLLLAKQQGWVGVTNDTTLRRAYEREDVEALGGLDLMLRAVENGVLAPDKARCIAQDIQRNNSLSPTRTLFARFSEQLDGRG